MRRGGESKHSMGKVFPCGVKNKHSMGKVFPCGEKKQTSMDKVFPCGVKSKHSMGKVSVYMHDKNEHAMDNVSFSARSTSKLSMSKVYNIILSKFKITI